LPPNNDLVPSTLFNSCYAISRNLNGIFMLGLLARPYLVLKRKSFGCKSVGD
jgi:hypothetical protein